MKIVRKAVVLFAFFIPVAFASHQCCKEDEYLVPKTRKCSDGAPPLLDCRRYLFKPEPGTSFRIDENKTLVVVDSRQRHSNFSVEYGKYCTSKLASYNSDVALICFEEYDQPFWELRAALAMVSIAFFILILVVYTIVPTLRDLQGKCTMHVVANSAMSYTLLSILQLSNFGKSPVCVILGFAAYFFFLAAFFWLNVVCFHVWRSSAHSTMQLSPDQLYRVSLGYGYGIPTFLLVATIVAHNVPGGHVKPGIGDNVCWFNSNEAKWYYFYMPVTFILVANIILFGWTAIILWKNVSICRQSSRLRVLRSKCILYIRLSIVMGLPWIFEILSFFFNEAKSFIHYVWIIFDYVNILQGFLIFLVLVAFRKRALKGVAKTGLVCCKRWKNIKDDESQHTEVVPSNADELRELNGGTRNQKDLNSA